MFQSAMGEYLARLAVAGIVLGPEVARFLGSRQANGQPQFVLPRYDERSAMCRLEDEDEVRRRLARGKADG